MPRCKHCKLTFIPRFFNQKFCLDKDPCITAFSEYAKSELLKTEKKKTAIKKEEQMTNSDWLKKLEIVFNKFIRLRDIKENCISCNRLPGTWRLSAGHYFPAGQNGSVRFDEDNVHGQCWYNCNSNKSGNLAEYLPRLIQKIGQQRFDELILRRRTPAHYSIPEIQDMIEHYKIKIKEIESDKN